MEESKETPLIHPKKVAIVNSSLKGLPEEVPANFCPILDTGSLKKSVNRQGICG